MVEPHGRAEELVLHIGTGKAGSKSIQAFLRANRRRLAEGGLLYPTTPGVPRHMRLGLFIKSTESIERAPAWRSQKESDPARFRRVFRRRLLSEIEDSGLPRVLLSDEVLFHQDDASLRRLRRLTGRMADSTRLVVYLRRQDDHMVSRYQQGIKTGKVLRLQEWAKGDHSLLYDYHARLRAWQRLQKPTDIVVRRFEPAAFVDGSLYQDFLDAAGIDARAEDLETVTNRNPSLDAETVEFLRLLNVYRVESEGARAGLIDNRGLVSPLAEGSTGPTLTLPERTLDEFMSRWEESNRRVAREFLHDETGELFRAPRRTRNTTTEQRLDPARLDHYLELLDLPEQVHAPLRQVAEREAKTR